MQNALSTLLVLLVCAVGRAQTADSHAKSGEFKQPTPDNRFRQDSARNNLAHPPGYVTAPKDTFGEVVEVGTGTVPVILIAGLGPGWRVFESFIESNKDDYRFQAVTLAGYGGSSAPPMPGDGTSFADLSWLKGSTRALAALVDEKQLERPLVVAFYSDAARIAVRYALAHPEKVGGVLVVSASAQFPLPEGAERGLGMDNFAGTWFKTVTEIMWPSGMWPTSAYCNDPALAEKTWWDVLSPTVPTAIRYTVETWADDLVPDLEKLKTPTVVLSPGFDEEYLSSQTGATIRQRFHAGWIAAVENGAPIEHTVIPNARLLLWEDQPNEMEGALAKVADMRAAGG